ncbi:MAG: hypothetical protein L6405_02470 [Actinomycetia bacterium]|nr:hypothetical protein [Actinomycetes bacterium]
MPNWGKEGSILKISSYSSSGFKFDIRQKLYTNCSALCASQLSNAAVNPVSKLKFAAGLAADP